ncbi:hypothetical protein D8M33_00775 [Micrococcus sp. HSID17245]|nr:hypothetical protein [Micrococcus sp. HSID17245]RUQ34420.1 hypothetical protein D8M33_00775 [Micrococcus sp. HSID17245]
MATVPWTAGETLLALGLAHDLEWTNPSKGTPAVVGLSRLLAQGPFHPGISLPDNFRNPNAVKMKVSNLIWHYSGGEHGLKQGAAQDLALVQLYRSDPALVLSLAHDLRSLVEQSFGDAALVPWPHE